MKDSLHGAKQPHFTPSVAPTSGPDTHVSEAESPATEPFSSHRATVHTTKKDLLGKKRDKWNNKKRKKETTNKYKNKEQDDRFKPNHTNNHTKCKFSNMTIKRQRLSDG